MHKMKLQGNKRQKNQRAKQELLIISDCIVLNKRSNMRGHWDDSHASPLTAFCKVSTEQQLRRNNNLRRVGIWSYRRLRLTQRY